MYNRTSQLTLFAFRRSLSLDELNCLLPAGTANPCTLKVVSSLDTTEPIPSSSLGGQVPPSHTTRISRNRPTRISTIFQGEGTLENLPRYIHHLAHGRASQIYLIIPQLESSKNNVDYIYYSLG